MASSCRCRSSSARPRANSLLNYGEERGPTGPAPPLHFERYSDQYDSIVVIRDAVWRRSVGALATAGVTILLFGATDTLGISLALAVTFALYGLVRKLTPVGSVPGLTIESGLLLPLALATTAWFAAGPALSSFGHDPRTSLLLIGAGVATAVPLLLFAVAARRMDYSTLGFTQFLAPTIVFVLGLTVFGEELRPAQLACFALIWSAIALFSWDLLARRERSSGTQSPA